MRQVCKERIRRDKVSEEVKHIQVNGKYRMQIERSATKGIDGFKVEANGDDMTLVEADAYLLYLKLKEMTATAAPNDTYISGQK